MSKERPVNLDLTKFSFPLPAIASITHRITGVALFAAIAYLLWLLGVALESPAGFAQVSATLGQVLPKLVLLAVLAALLYHLLAGLKHLVMDFGHWETLGGAQRASQAVFALTIIGTVLAGVWLW